MARGPNVGSSIFFAVVIAFVAVINIIVFATKIALYKPRIFSQRGECMTAEIASLTRVDWSCHRVCTTPKTKPSLPQQISRHALIHMFFFGRRLLKQADTHLIRFGVQSIYIWKSSTACVLQAAMTAWWLQLRRRRAQRPHMSLAASWRPRHQLSHKSRVCLRTHCSCCWRCCSQASAPVIICYISCIMFAI